MTSKHQSRCIINALVVSIIFVGVLATGPPDKPTWPTNFFCQFEEYFKGGGGQSNPGAFVLDLDYIDNATGIKGAQAILRNDGTADESCNAVNPGPKCVTLAVGGQRYLSFESGAPLCCRCCSWKNGCGPLIPKWTENATFAGTKIVRGEVCNSFKIQGFSTNYLHVRASDGQICELDNGMTDFMEFIPPSYKPLGPSLAKDLFKVPGGCDTWCGAHGDCKFGNSTDAKPR
jgi:hypothetical protein